VDALNDAINAKEHTVKVMERFKYWQYNFSLQILKVELWIRIQKGKNDQQK
jgi:hypothetical protein